MDVRALRKKTATELWKLKKEERESVSKRETK